MDFRRICEQGAALALALALSASPAALQQRGVEGRVRVRSGAVEGAVVVFTPEADALPASAPIDAVIDQRQLRFEPSVVVIRPGTTVTFLNSDPLLHNVFSPPHRGESFDLGTYPPAESRAHTFTRSGSYVILCHVHPEMAAHVVVASSPYAAVSDGEGRFRIGEIPPGEYWLQVWHRGVRPKLERVVTIDSTGPHGLEIDLGRAQSSASPVAVRP